MKKPIKSSLLKQRLLTRWVNLELPAKPRKIRAIGGFHSSYPRIQEGTWVVTVAFRIAGTPVAPFEGAAYANPRQEDGLRLLQRLATQERLPFFFLSPHLKVVVRQEAGWSVHHRQEVRLLLAQVAHAQTNKRLTEGEDLDFARAKKEFQDLYSIRTLLAIHPRSEVRPSSPFRGVVLE